MQNKQIGNRITDNALYADNGADLIKYALEFIEKKFGWQPEKQSLFSGVYYDAAKVGSYITKIHKQDATAVLKLQLRPLPFDEGFIIRHVSTQNKSHSIKLPQILADEPWGEEKKFGFLIFEDLSKLPNLWTTAKNITAEEKNNHKLFLKEFLHNFLPVEPFLPKPNISLKEKIIESFEHFHDIAVASQHKHIEDNKIEKAKKIYLDIVEKCSFEDYHFSHGHLSGLDIKFDTTKKTFIPLANLYWSYRPKYYELTFPIWVNIMHQTDNDITFQDIQKIILDWTKLWSTDLFDTPPENSEQYWFNLLERAMMTIILDLGASQWKDEEKITKQKLLLIWEEVFYWIAQEKFKYNSKRKGLL